MNWIEHFFRASMIVVSAPYLDESGWVYVIGDEKGYRIRKFKDQEDAYSSLEATKLGLRLAPEISVRLINITAEQASALTGQFSYQAAVKGWREDSGEATA